MLMWDRGEMALRMKWGVSNLGEKKGESEELLMICQENNMKVVNTWFKKKREHLITYKSGDLESQIDYVMLRRNEVVNEKNCNVIPGEGCLTQHRLLCCDFIIRNMKMLKRIKLWKLKNEQRRKHFEERLNERMAGTTSGRTGLSNAVMETAKEVCGESRGQRHRERQTWWWCEEVQQAIKEKRDAYKR